MTKNTTKKPAAKKATAKAPEPMDASVRETVTPEIAANAHRKCHAIKQLISEVDALYPEVPTQTGNIDGRNTALDVEFDLTVLDLVDQTLATELLMLVQNDERVAEVLASDSQVLVSFRSNPRTQDSRASFNLGDAYDILIEKDLGGFTFDGGGSW